MDSTCNLRIRKLRSREVVGQESVSDVSSAECRMKSVVANNIWRQNRVRLLLPNMRPQRRLWLEKLHRRWIAKVSAHLYDRYSCIRRSSLLKMSTIVPSLCVEIGRIDLFYELLLTVNPWNYRQRWVRKGESSYFPWGPTLLCWKVARQNYKLLHANVSVFSGILNGWDIVRIENKKELY